MNPFLKWVGGKRRSVPEILSVLPTWIETYREPFVGGGAVFWALAETRSFRSAVLCDSNEELMVTYQVVRDRVDELLDLLARMTRRGIDRDRYYRIARPRPQKDLVGRAARMIVLNHTSFNGLYRVNRSGVFNVPFGRYRSPLIYDAGHLRACSALLQGVTLISGHYLEALVGVEHGDAVYFDPPYLGPKSFVGYGPSPFGEDDHARLAQACRWLTDLGVSWVVSNSPEARPLYPSSSIREIEVGRQISCKATGRKPVKELLIWE